MQNFTEEKLEEAIIELLQAQNINFVEGSKIERSSGDVILYDDLQKYLHNLKMFFYL